MTNGGYSAKSDGKYTFPTGYETAQNGRAGLREIDGAGGRCGGYFGIIGPKIPPIP